jgi:hypothetical protein
MEELRGIPNARETARFFLNKITLRRKLTVSWIGPEDLAVLEFLSARVIWIVPGYVES